MSVNPYKKQCPFGYPIKKVLVEIHIIYVGPYPYGSLPTGFPTLPGTIKFKNSSTNA